jgi:UDP-glucose 4-epimerase
MPSMTGCAVYNLGTGQGYSVLEMVAAFEKASGRKVPHRIVGRREGDIGSCYGDVALARTELGWTAQRGLKEMVEDMWRWQEQNPVGYAKEDGVAKE